MTQAAEITARALRAWPLPPLSDDSDKDSRGRVFVAAAGAEVAGATLLTAVAALRAGAGKLQIGAPRSIATALALAVPEARVIPGAETPDGELSPEAAESFARSLARSDAAVIGPGMLDEAAAGELTLRLLHTDGPALVVDAAAMLGLAHDPKGARRRAGEMVLTPHAGEMASLTGCSKAEVAADPSAAARAAAARFKAVVVMKGSTTLVVSPDGKAWRHVGGQAGLATSGSGDVLAGVIAGLLARGAAPAQAAVWAVFLHAEAGARLRRRLGRVGFLARELLDELAPALDELDRPEG
jgi:ADP-dependent NAD(P)H-hydrate dehydratase